MRNIIPLYPEPPAIHEAAEEYDRKECIALDLKVDGANKELAQWLLDHPSYTNVAVANWLGCGKTRIADLRIWAKNGFVKTPSHARRERADHTNHGRPADQEALKTHDNFQDDDSEPSDDVADPDHILGNILDDIDQAKAVAEAYRKILKRSPFDSEAKVKIYNAIQNLIVKWRTVQSTLDKKGHGNG